jgi:hypothetical protein
MASLKINARSGGKSLSASIQKEVEDTVEPKLRAELEAIGDYATNISPVYSGAYVESFSFVPAGSGAGRMRKPRPDPDDDRREQRWEIISGAQAELRDDLNKIDLMKVSGVVLRNRSPHARDVEYGPTPRNPSGYAVFAKVKDKFR